MPSVYIVKPKTIICRDWMRESVEEGATWFAGGLAVEWRYLEDLLLGLEGAEFVNNIDYEVIY